jgi:hypothetical protein
MGEANPPGEPRPPRESETVEPEDAQDEPRLTRGDWVTGGVVLAAYAAVQLALLQGPRPFDPSIYFDAGLDFPDVEPSVWTLRIGLVGPVNAAARVFGPSEAALYAVPLASGLVLTGAAFLLALLLFRDRVVAAAAGLVTGLNSYYLLNSSFIFPDTTATATATAGFLCLVLGAMRAPEGRRRWAVIAAVIGAGVFFGWTYLIREFSVALLLPAVVAAVVLLRYSLSRVLILGGAALATFGLELIYGLLRYDEPFIHLRLLLSEHPDRPVSRGDAPIVDRYHDQMENLLDTAVVFPRLLVSWLVGWVFLLLIGIFLVALVWLRDRRLWLPAAWCFSFWAVMAVVGLGSLPSGRWIVNITNIRYWYPLLPPLVIGAFAGASLLVQKFFPTIRGVSLAHPLTIALAALALVPGVVEYRSCAATGAWASDSLASWHELRSWLATPEAQRYTAIWTDKNTARLVPAFAARTFGEELWDGQAEKLFDYRERVIATPDPASSVILVNKDRFLYESSLRALDREWSPIFASDDGRLVVLAHEPQTGAGGSAGASTWWALAAPDGEERDTRTCRMRPYAPPS